MAIRRRELVKKGLLTGAGVCLSPEMLRAYYSKEVEITKLTNGPRQHWFGYYDKWQIDPTGRYLLGMEVDLLHIHQNRKIPSILVSLI